MLADWLGAAVRSATAPNKTSAAIAAGIPGAARRSTAEVPFSSARKWSAVAFDDPGGQGGTGAVGASEPLHGIVAYGAPTMLQVYLRADGAEGRPTWEHIEQQVVDLARQGLRVLLVVQSPSTALEDRDDDSVLPADMTPLGLVTLEDVLRPEAAAALAAFIEAGVSPRVISGDDPETVTALARQAGLGPELELL
jgi:cation-transporting ATPase E